MVKLAGMWAETAGSSVNYLTGPSMQPAWPTCVQESHVHLCQVLPLSGQMCDLWTEQACNMHEHMVGHAWQMRLDNVVHSL